jgi:hypothetical protein
MTFGFVQANAELILEHYDQLGSSDCLHVLKKAPAEMARLLILMFTTRIADKPTADIYERMIKQMDNNPMLVIHMGNIIHKMGDTTRIGCDHWF